MILPQLPQLYHDALQLAVHFIMQTFDPAGIIAAGTIVHGTPDLASDLDIYVIHHKPVRQRLQRFFNGVPAEIFVNPPHQIRDYFRTEHQAGRPCTAHMLATGVAVLDQDPIIEQLQQEARGWLKEPPVYTQTALMMKRYSAATLFEDAMDIWEKDPAGAQSILAEAVMTMTIYRFQIANLSIPRQKDLFGRLAILDPEAGRLAKMFWTLTDAEEKRGVAGRLADHILGTRGFYEWETALEPCLIND